jgi:23S rRNA (cytosine1962-C5)-methyltransferase
MHAVLLTRDDVIQPICNIVSLFPFQTETMTRNLLTLILLSGIILVIRNASAFLVREREFNPNTARLQKVFASDEKKSRLSASKSSYPALIKSIQEFQRTNTFNDTCRIFHGRGGVFPGCEHITMDWFPPVFLLTSYNDEISASELAEIQKTVEKGSSLLVDEDENTPSANLVYQHRTPINATTTILKGTIPNPHVVSEKGMHFLVRLDRSKNHGIFLDMANGRQWLQQRASGKRVLNLFAYTCGFSVAALSGGATSVVNVDMVDGVLKVGQQNHDLNRLKGARFLAHDIFKSWGKIRKLGPYDIIVADPPSFQKKSFVAKKDYGKLVRRLPDLLAERGEVLLCLNAPELDTQWLRDIVSEEAPSLSFVERLGNPTSFPSADNERSLKVLRYQLVANSCPQEDCGVIR